MKRQVESYSVPCGSCGAGTGEPCRIPSWPQPRRAHYTHASRRKAVAEVASGDES